jgi:hypothetical protein
LPGSSSERSLFWFVFFVAMKITIPVETCLNLPWGRGTEMA